MIKHYYKITYTIYFFQLTLFISAIYGFRTFSETWSFLDFFSSFILLTFSGMVFAVGRVFRRQILKGLGESHKAAVSIYENSNRRTRRKMIASIKKDKK